jgi:ribonuclease G
MHPEPADGYIVRTAAEGVGEQMMRADLEFLQKLWGSMQSRAGSVPTPGMVYEDMPLVIRTLRELIGTSIEKIRIDSRDTYRHVIDFAYQFIPELVSRIEHYAGERPIFDLYGVEDEIQKALERKVQLKSGGHLVLDQTEAMTTIDVNTGAYVGHRNLEETIFKTNLEASQAIARQLRLRNLGGIIIIDFIDMSSEEHKRQVLRSLEKSLDRDHTKSHISDVSPVGLVQMTRKRTRESLEHTLCMPCPTCDGSGSVKTPETVCYEIFREILREARQFDTERLLVLASQEVVDTLVDEESTTFAELEEFIGKPITVQVESLYTQEQYDVVLM